jgi:hypothetical protein
MKTSRDISPTAPGTTTTRGKITDPDIASKPTTATPVAIPIGESSPGNLEAMDIPTPPTRTGEMPNTVRPGLGGDPAPLTEVAAAPTDDPRYDSVAAEYHAPPSNLPIQVSAAQVARDNVRFWGNIGPADSEVSAPVVGSLDALRRQAGGR